MGGRIKVKSIVGTGTSFIIKIPTETAPLESRKELTPFKRALTSILTRMMVVDDDAFTNDFIDKFLEGSPLNIEIAKVAKTGQEALDFFRSTFATQNKIGIIYFNNEISDRSTISTIEKIREFELTQQ